MRANFRGALTAAGVVVASLALASCGHHAPSLGASRPAPHLAAVPIAPVPRADPQLVSTAAVWSLRAGLNVAALSCRGKGRQPVASHYARLLSRHRAVLDAAYRREQARQGAAAFDRQQTRLYNGFANQASPAAFCAAASTLAQRANGLTSPAFAAAAPRLLGDLRASLRQRPVAPQGRIARR